MAKRTRSQPDGRRQERPHERPAGKPAQEARDDWGPARPEHIPRPTYWPAALALGVTFFLWGFLTTWIIAVIGLVLMGVSLAGWIGEWRHEH